MPPERTLGEALCNSGLWLDLFCTATYYSSAEKQARFLSRIRETFAGKDHQPAFREIARDTGAAPKVDGLFALKESPRFEELTGRYLSALAVGIERELSRRRPLPIPPDLQGSIRETFASLGFFDGADVLEISEAGTDECVYVNYISRRFSPRYDGREGPWDRDTQFKIELIFQSGLFVWLSANVSAEFRGRKMGTELIGKCQEAARMAGFRRFSVPGPNKEFWAKMGYSVDPRQRVVIDPNHNPNLEAYKEDS